MSGLEPTHRVGQFELVRLLERDASREWWLGSRIVAGAAELARIELCPPDTPATDPTLDELRKAAEVGARLRHPHIVSLLDAGEVAGRSYVAWEFLDARCNDLTTSIEALRDDDDVRRLTCIAHIAKALLEALAHAHAMRGPGHPLGLAHGRIDARAVMLSRTGAVKIAGFGVGRRTTEGTAGLLASDTLRSMAPEALHGRGLLPSGDLYAAGILLHTLLDGEPPWPDLDAEALYRAILSGESPRLQRPAPEPLVALHDALVATDLRRRIPSATEALALLQRWSDPTPDPTRVIASLVADASSPRRPDVGLDLSTAEPSGWVRSTAAAPHDRAPTPDPPQTSGRSAPAAPPMPVLEPRVPSPPGSEIDEGTTLIDDAVLARMREETSREQARRSHATSEGASPLGPAPALAGAMTPPSSGPAPTFGDANRRVPSPTSPSTQARDRASRISADTPARATPRPPSSPNRGGVGPLVGQVEPAHPPSPLEPRRAPDPAPAIAPGPAIPPVSPNAPLPRMSEVPRRPDEPTSTAVLEARHRKRMLTFVLAGVFIAIVLGTIVGLVLAS